MSLPSYVQQELRNVASVLCRELVMANKGEGMKQQSQEDLMFNTFHGSPAHISNIQSMLKGNEPYTEMFYKLGMESNREGNAARGADGVDYMLELKGTLHLQPDKRLIVHECGFTEKAICEDGKGSKLTARNIYDRARSCIANYRIALVFYKEYSGTMEPGVNPSGQNFDDMIVAKESRKQVREEEAQQRDHERAANVGGDDIFKRGVPVHEKKMAYQMASTAHVHAQKNARDLLAIANADHAATSKEFFEVVKLLKESTSEEEKETYKEWKEQLAKDLGGIRKRKRQLQEKCDSLMKVSKQESAMANDYFGRVSNVVKATSPVPQPSPLTVDTAVASHPAINKTSEEYQSHCSQLAQSQASEASSEMSGRLMQYREQQFLLHWKRKTLPNNEFAL
ncbi:unknown protein [Seminavis robusta]|uniref:Uncharacterized protein n=1 Tax=Seminavis robusta TaxID=568900 RepID=A0A9N8EG98_9STRA|nr:unknown protein [Seminavis robusta]|eukprot:Sro947_g223420.1 n/a (396) ;mRNA; f:15373-16782